MGGSRKLSCHYTQSHLLIFCKNMSILEIGLQHPMPYHLLLFSALLLTQPHFPENTPKETDPLSSLDSCQSASLQGKQTSHFQMLTAITLVMPVTFSLFAHQKLMSAWHCAKCFGKIHRQTLPLRSSTCNRLKC